MCLNYLSKWKIGKNFINGYIRVTSRANWEAKPKTLPGRWTSVNKSFSPRSSAINAFLKAVSACTAEKQGNNSKRETFL